MRAFFYIGIVGLFVACSSNQPQSTQNANARLTAENQQNAVVHTSENQAPGNSNTASKWTQSGEPIDTTKFDKAIADAEKAVKAKPDDDAAQKALAQAYYERGFALTEARQYASALGDYRRTVKYDPDNAEAKEWIDQIVTIYTMLKRQPPNEGEEPKALPMKKTGVNKASNGR
jgi:tetratricopeptide (TPR) repeat protein